MERSEANRLIAEWMGWTGLDEVERVFGVPIVWGKRPGTDQFFHIPDYFTDPQAMVELMGKAHIGVMPSRGAWAASRRATTGDDLFIEKHGETPMEAVALAAVEMIQKQGAAHEH